MVNLESKSLVFNVSLIEDYVEIICQLKRLICYKNNLKDQFITNIKLKGPLV